MTQVWTVVVPVKRLGVAKSRLRGALPDQPHEALALALAVDTVSAVLACPVVADVLVVTDDPAVATETGMAGARVVPDRPAAGLNSAVRHGAATAGAGWIAGLTADLPALRPAELAAALSAARTGPTSRRYLPDAPGTGTVLLAAPPGVPLNPRFGGSSAAAHAASGALALLGDWPSLRRDVDTATDLAEAARLGLGPRTALLCGTAAPTAGRSV